MFMMKGYLGLKLYETCLAHARADRALRTFIANELEGHDITLMEWLMLSVVCNGPKEGLSMSAVARELDVTLPQVTSLANKLLVQQQIEQKIQAHDRRARHVFPTARGKRTWQDVEKSLAQNIDRWLHVDAKLSQEDVQHYVRVAKLIAGSS